MIGGLTERRNQYREVGVPSFPEHYGGTCRAGKDWEVNKAAEERARWEKKPPAKRPQFAALGTSHPWTPDWVSVLGSLDEESTINGSETANSPWLVTGPIRLHIDAICNRNKAPQATLLKIVNAFREQRGCPALQPTIAESLYSTAVLHVRLEVEARGSPGDMAIIYSISAKEREAWLSAKEKDEKYGRADWDQNDPKREMQKVNSPSASLTTK